MKKRFAALLPAAALIASMFGGPVGVQAVHDSTEDLPPEDGYTEPLSPEDDGDLGLSLLLDEPGEPADPAAGDPENDLVPAANDTEDAVTPATDEPENDLVPVADNTDEALALAADNAGNAVSPASDEGDISLADAADLYELKQVQGIFNFVMSFKTLPSSWNYHTFTAGAVTEKGTTTPAPDVSYAWYPADVATGAIVAGAEPLSTEQSFCVDDDPHYDLTRAASHWYRVEAYVGGTYEDGTPVGSQLFCAAIIDRRTYALPLIATQNGTYLAAEEGDLSNGPITIKVATDDNPLLSMTENPVGFNATFNTRLANSLKSMTSQTIMPLTGVQLTPATGAWLPTEGLDATQSGLSSLNGVALPNQGIAAPSIEIREITAGPTDRDMYCTMTFPATANNKTAAGTITMVMGPIRVFDSAAPAPSHDPALEPSQDPSGEASQSPLPSLSPDVVTNIFAQSPMSVAEAKALYNSIVAPYHDTTSKDPFELKPAVMEDGKLSMDSQKGLLGLVNYVRRSAGVEMVNDISEQYSAYAQAGTDYLQKTNTSGHFAADGSGDTAAKTGLHNSNLAWVEYSTGEPGKLTYMQMGQFYDDDSRNLQTLGHRRWLLDNRLTKTGFGYTPPTSSNKGTNQATYIMDDVYHYATGQSFEAFPGAGAYPIELMDFRAWSLGVGKVGWTVDESEVTVKITLDDGRSWNLDRYQGGGLMVTDDWYTVISGGKGSGPVIMFRPSCAYSDRNFGNAGQLDGHTVTVEIGGLRDVSGTPRTVGYSTQFFSMADAVTSRPTTPSPSTVPSQAVTPSAVPSQSVTPSTVPSQAVTPSTVPSQAVIPSTVPSQAVIPSTVPSQPVIVPSPSTIVPAQSPTPVPAQTASALPVQSSQPTATNSPAASQVAATASPSASASDEASAPASASAASSAAASSSEPAGSQASTGSAAPAASTPPAPQIRPEAQEHVVVATITDGNKTTNIVAGIPMLSREEHNSSTATTAEHAQQWLSVPEGATVQVTQNGKDVTNEKSSLATGQVVRVTDQDGNVIQEAVMVIPGDVLGTGRADLSQVARLAAAFLGREPLDGAYFKAGDWTGDNKLTITDLVRQAQQYKELS